MRIEVIHFRNLASLEGEWEIDLTHPAYQDYGLFAVTGVTGAGKSTIFDAVRLALYRRTDRLESFATENEIMTRGSAECFARVRFLLGGKRYVASWRQARARNRVNGKLQPDTHTLEEYLPDGTLKMLAEKRTEADRAIRELLHMDFGHFSRAMLLPQGEFAIFLKSPAPERSEILEQITGSEIYRRISAAAYRKFTAEQEKITLARAGMEAIRLLPQEDAESLKNQLSGQETLLNESTTRSVAAARLAEDLRKREEARIELAKLDGELKELIPRQKEFTEKLKQAEMFRQECEKHLESTRPLLQTARLLDASLERLNREQQNREETIRREEEMKLREEREFAALEHSAETAGEKAAEAQRLLDSRPEDASLAAAAPQLLAKFEALQQLRRTLTEEEKQLSQNRRKPEELKQERLVPEQKLTAVQKTLENLRPRLLSEEAFLALNARAALDSERTALAPGIPCPLCGATDHPYEGQRGRFSRELEEAGELRVEFRKLEKEERTLSSLLQTTDAGLAAATALITEAERRTAQLAERLRTAEKELATLLEPFEIHTSEELNARCVSRLAAEKALLSATRTAEKSRTEREVLKTRLAARQERLIELTSARKKAAGELKQFQKERKSLLENRPADTVEKELTAAVHRGQEVEQQKLQAHRLLEQNLLQLKTRRESVEEIVEKLAVLPEIPAAEQRQKCAELDESLRQLTEKTGALKEKLRNNEEAAARRGKEAEKLAAMQKELERWRLLNELIGKQDGGKFQLFAQSLIFRQLIRLANEALRKFTDRYELISIPDTPLDFNVIDRYQCDEIRSVKNLSGGESFLVSMSLALALSRMSGENLRIDTLFLDEGFGTLDEETLERVLNKIQFLREEGKLIGIIAHAPGLENHVPLRIELQPAERDGRSIITGPGVRALS